jgi:hypothetical protein
MFPRVAQLGLPTPLYDDGNIRPDQFHEVQTRVLSPLALDSEAPLGQRLDVAGVAQGAAVGMRVPGVGPGTAIQLSNVHPTQPVWSFQLPSEVPRVAYRLPGRKSDELVPHIRCLVIEPDRDAFTVLWAASRPIDEPLTPDQVARIEHGVIWP